MKIYVVTSGGYSDYGIDAVFVNKEKAKLYCKVHKDSCIEEYDTNDDNINNNSILYHYNVTYIPKCNYFSVQSEAVEAYPKLDLSEVYKHRPERVSRKTTSNEQFTLSWYDKNEYDIDTAKKIFFDKLTQHRAEEEGIT